MAVNILVGIGGTGAKVVEAALHCMAAGIGPADPVLVGVVDQDNGNGNVLRTLELLESIRRVRAMLSEQRRNQLNWKAAPKDGGTALFQVDVQPLMKEGAHWRPANDDVRDLSYILQRDRMSPGEKALFDLLFRGANASPADEEQTMALSEGYRGRAHVGSAAMLAAFHFDSTDFRDRLKELMRRSKQGEEVRIFLVGSLFGGTGAAGFPTIARTLHDIREAGQDEDIDKAKVHIGGALMLPYFSFRDPDDREANVVRSAQLLPQAKAALAFYDSLFREATVFDRLHVVGWDRLFELDYHVPGRNEQRNPPLLPELLGALSAAEFFMAGRIEKQDGLLVAGRSASAAIAWDDLPQAEALKQLGYQRLAQMLRFACWWRYRVEPSFDNRGGWFGGGDLVAGKIKIPWLKRLAEGTDWQTETPELRQALTRLLEQHLVWAGGVQIYANRIQSDFALWDVGGMRHPDHESTPTDPLALHAARSETDTLADLSRLVRDRDPQDPARSATIVYDEIADTRRPLPPNAGVGLGRVIWAVHHAVRPTNQEA